MAAEAGSRVVDGHNTKLCVFRAETVGGRVQGCVVFRAETVEGKRGVN